MRAGTLGIRENSSITNKQGRGPGASRNPSIRHGVNEASADRVARGLGAESIGRWRRDLSGDDRIAFKQRAGDLLIELGYADDDRW